MLGVCFVHVMVLGLPHAWTDAVGISDEIDHAFAVGGGVLAGAATLAGRAILVYRLRTVGPVFSATTVMDKVMYAVLAVVILLGIWNTIAGGILNLGGHYNYREGVSVWFRGIFRFDLHPALMGEADRKGVV